ncbi:MAG: DUF58 domain-containing protein [Chloroflexi bacterium]|nr:DUF58 domain-containing protein [Chloroflexota bacterium]
MVPTPILGGLFIAGAGLLALGAWKSIFLWAALTFNILVILAALYDYRRLPGQGGFVIKRTGDNRLSQGVPNPVSISARSRAGLPSIIKIKDEPPEYFRAKGLETEGMLNPGEEKIFTYHVTPLSRGSFEFGGINLRALSPMGLVWKQYKYPGKWEVKVYPDLSGIKKYELVSRKGSPLDTGLKLSRVPGIGREFERLREYQPDDEYRQINWKATARRGKPISQIYQTERYQEVFLIIDAGRTMTSPVCGAERLDYAINGALLLAFAASKQDDRVGLLTFSDSVKTYIPPHKGRRHLFGIAEALNDTKAMITDSNYGEAFRFLACKKPKRALLVIFSDPADARETGRLVKSLSPLCPPHLPLFVTFSDPEISSLAHKTPGEISDVYEKGTAHMFLRKRAAILNGLKKKGGIVLECTPDDLSVKLINSYLRIKSRMQL